MACPLKMLKGLSFEDRNRVYKQSDCFVKNTLWKEEAFFFSCWLSPSTTCQMMVTCSHEVALEHWMLIPSITNTWSRDLESLFYEGLCCNGTGEPYWWKSACLFNCCTHQSHFFHNSKFSLSFSYSPDFVKAKQTKKNKNNIYVNKPWYAMDSSLSSTTIMAL